MVAEHPVLALPIKGTPRQHQIDAARFALDRPATALLHEMGCGKTFTTIAIAGVRFLARDIPRLLVVCPASVLATWETEFEKWADYPYELRILHGQMQKRRDMLAARWTPGALQVAVINYEGMWRMYEDVKEWASSVAQVVADESPKIKTPGSKQSKAMHNLGRIVPFRMNATGTPVTHGPLDVYSQYKFLDPRIFGTSFVAHKHRYAIEKQMPNYRLVVGYRNLDDLAMRAHSIAHRVRRADVLDLPPALDTVRYCYLSGEGFKAYKDILQRSVTELEGGERLIVTNVLTKLLRLSQITGGFLQTEASQRAQPVSTAKLELLSDTLDEALDEGHKVVVFTRFVAEMAAIRSMLDAKRVKYSSIAGDIPIGDRGYIVDRFQDDQDVRVMVAQIQAGGLGINLQAADVAIFYSLDYSYGNYEQAKSRIYRDGQTRPCTFIHLIAKGTVDEKVMQALAAKRDVADLVVDNWRQMFE